MLTDIINFDEVTPSQWENFACAFFENNDYQIIERPSIGQDNLPGKDLIIQIKKDGFPPAKFFVSCKHKIKGKPISPDDESFGNTALALAKANCQGLILFYSTNPTSGLRNLIIDTPFLIELWDFNKIMSALQNDKNLNLFKTYFQNSYKAWAKFGKSSIEENSNFKLLSKKDFIEKDNEYFKRFFNGERAEWYILKKYTFIREAAKKTINHIDNNKIAIITGAGGEGKTTLLMQIAEHFFAKKYTVLYSFDGINSINANELTFNPRKQYFILIDQANYLKNIVQFLEKIKLNKNIKVLLSSRHNEWLQFITQNHDYKQIKTLVGEEIILGRLTQSEISSLVDLLSRNNLLTIKDQNLQEIINEGSNNSFLLAIMLLVTKGQKLEYIIEDILNNISKWKYGPQTLMTISYIVCIEVLGNKSQNQTKCTESLIKSLTSFDNEIFYEVKKNLAEEAFVRSSGNIIQTRNPVIADVYFKKIFSNDISRFNLLDFYLNIIYNIILTNTPYERNLLSIIPIFLRKNQLQFSAIEAIKTTVTLGFFSPNWQVFIDDEIQKDNLGAYSTDDYSARWLCQKACEKNPSDVNLYLRWAKLEKTFGNIGGFEAPYTVRWILRAAFNQNFSNPDFYCFWAEVEAIADNFGDDDFKEFTARWLLKTGFEKQPAPDLCITWAKLELGQNHNLGDKEFKNEYSARWILEKGFKYHPTSDLIITWAKIEAENDNLGDKDFKQKYTARWLMKTGFDQSLDPALRIVWAQIESDNDNIGSPQYDQKYSARWLLKESYKTNSDPQLLMSWALLEANNNNIGDKEFKTEYSARWIFKKGFELKPEPHIVISWAKLEVDNDNIGDREFKTEYSARWLFKKGFDLKPEPQLLTNWAQLEIDNDNIGDREFKTEYSARWLFKKGFDLKLEPQLLTNWAKLELLNGNLGDKEFEEKFSARWILKQAYDLNIDIYILWAKIEIIALNPGSIKTPFSATSLINQSKNRNGETQYLLLLSTILEIVFNNQTKASELFNHASKLNKNALCIFNGLVFIKFIEFQRYIQQANNISDILFQSRK